MKSVRFQATALLLALCAGTAPLVVAQSSEESGETEGWEYGTQVYLWGADLDITSAEGIHQEIKFADLVENLGFAFMGILAARRDKWTLLTDVIYLDVDDDVENNLLPGVQLKNLGIKAWVVTPLVAYRLFEGEKLSVNLVGGARYLWIEVPLEFQFSAPLPPEQRNSSESDSVWDGVVGVRGRYELSDKWYVSYHADAGAGDSEYCTLLCGLLTANDAVGGLFMGCPAP